MRSGGVPEVAMHQLYAGARVVIFPSFYEGFGFPILSTLAYGGTVVVRRSALVEEIAARVRGGGRIVPFDRRDDLLEIVGRILHGEAVDTLPLGTAVGEHGPLTWRDVAERVMTFLGDVTRSVSRSRWQAREHAVAQLLAAPSSLADRPARRPRSGDAAAVSTG